MSYSGDFKRVAADIKDGITKEIYRRGARATKALHSSEQEVLRGQRHGRMYGRHQASAPGEPPAVLTGRLRQNWSESTRKEGNRTVCELVSNTEYAGALEYGSGHVAARPYVEKIIETAQPEIVQIFSEPYNVL